MDDTICRTVNIRVPGLLLMTHRAEGLRDTHCGIRLVIISLSIHQSFQVIALGCVLFARDRISQQAVV